MWELVQWLVMVARGPEGYECALIDSMFVAPHQDYASQALRLWWYALIHTPQEQGSNRIQKWGRGRKVAWTCPGPSLVVIMMYALGDKVVISDPVNHPSHYTMGKYEVLDVIEDWGLDKDMHLGNAVKYIARAGYKDPAKKIEDLQKAEFYLSRRIRLLQEEEEKERMARETMVGKSPGSEA